ncbi:MAG: YkgJ family cysteine cluster protein [Deltaproteobacteria bacterium]|nr:YkgJ family cysteine cluster protein [Deltaproteobacteria bacterium]
MRPIPLTALLAPWRQIMAKVDAFFGEVTSRHAEALQCRHGCSLCCGQELSVMLVEAIAVVEGIEKLSARTRHELEESAAAENKPCVFLHEGGCRIYAERPLLCRSHGLPIRQHGEVAACELNFTAGHPPDAILDGGWLTAALTTANGILQEQLKLEHTPRVSLRELARRGRAALPEDLIRKLAPSDDASPEEASEL